MSSSSSSSSSCQYTTPGSCHDYTKFIEIIHKHIERCMDKHMIREQAVQYLQHKFGIHRDLTEAIWKQLEEESPDYFRIYYKQCAIARQVNMYNDFLVKNTALLLEKLDLCKAPLPPELKSFLSQRPDGRRVLDNLAKKNPFKAEAISPSLTLPVTNGPAENQLQIPNGQQNQLWQYPLSTPDDFAYNCGASNGGTVNQFQMPIAQQNHLHHHPLYTPSDFSAAQLPILSNQQNDQHHVLWPTLNDLPYNNCLGAQPVAPAAMNPWSTSGIGAPLTVQQAAPAPIGPSRFDYGGPSSFRDMDTDQLVRELDRQNQLPQQLQQNISQVRQPALQRGGGSNRPQYGERIVQQYNQNFDPNQSMHAYTNVDQQQAGRVILHLPTEHKPLQRESPESEVLNPPDNTQNQLKRECPERRKQYFRGQH